tara:strand:- start:1671 stop:1976 length:306 start_codon:yes stop_codon:yes gene_type:complete
MQGMSERERELFHLDKKELVEIIILYESKLNIDEEVSAEIQMLKHELKYPGKSMYYYNRQTDKEAEAALTRYTEKLRRENAKYKINKSKRKKTAKLRKRST